MKYYHLFFIVPLFLLVTWLVGCGVQPISQPEAIIERVQSGESSPLPKPKSTPALTVTSPQGKEKITPSPMASEIKPPDATEPVVQVAQSDLARRLGLATEAIYLVSIEEAKWSDASLGCPEPGIMYAPTVTPGFLVVLQAADKVYEYHADTRQNVIYCKPQAERPLMDNKSTETVKLAKEDLARRLGLAIDSIDVLAVIGQEFPPNAFYCRVTKQRTARDESPAVIAGESILLGAAGHKYEYHASDQTVVFCRQLPK
jgi:hypothetical protein